MNGHRIAAIAALVLLPAAAGPAGALADVTPPGDIPDNQVFVAYAGRGYTLRVPEGWARVTRAGTTAFSHTFQSISVAVARRPAWPTVASATRGELPVLRRSTPGFAAASVTPVTRAGGRGVRVTYRALSTPDAVTGKRIVQDVQRYELWRAGRVAILTLAAPHGSDTVDAWNLVTGSLRLR